MAIKKDQTDLVYGINPVREALKAAARRCHKIVIEKGKTNPRIRSILKLSDTRKVKLETLSHTVFQKKYRSYPHQGIVAYFSVKEPLDLEELVRQAFQNDPQPTLVLLDEVQDPQNLGAIIRSAEVLGIQGLVLPKHRSASLNETVAKCSAGAVENLPIATTNNLATALDFLKKAGFWIVGIDPRGEKPCYEFQFDLPVALLIGGEEKGIRPLLKKNCDFTLMIPMQGTLESLNASAASTVVFYEILRQKKQKEKKKGLKNTAPSDAKKRPEFS